MFSLELEKIEAGQFAESVVDNSNEEKETVDDERYKPLSRGTLDALNYLNSVRSKLDPHKYTIFLSLMGDVNLNM